MAAVVVTFAPWRARRVVAQPRRHQCCRAQEEQQQGGQGQGSDGDEKQQSSVKMEVSSSVMRMFQGRDDGAAGGGLIEANERKRKKKNKEMEQSYEMMGFVREELFGKTDIYIPRHDNLFPLLVATFATVYADDDEDDGNDDRFSISSSSSSSSSSSGLSRLKAVVDRDVARFKARSLLASGLFCDLNGEPLNSVSHTDMRFERWFVLSMYVKFKLWWKGPSAAAELALDYAYRMSNFILDADGELGRVLDTVSAGLPSRRLAVRYGRVCLLSSPTSINAATLQSQLQSELDKRNRGWAAFVLNAGAAGAGGGDQVACLLTHCTSLIFLHLPERQAAAISYFMLAWAAASSANLSMPSPSLWQCVPPLGLLAVVAGGTLLRRAVASLYGVLWAVTPLFVLPVPQLGAIPTFVYYRGCLPNRRCLFDLSAATSLLQLALSALLVAAGASAALPVVEVSSRAFAHSGLLTWMLKELSSSVWPWEGDGDPVVSLSPLALGGLLGFNFTLVSLLPCGVSEGGRMLTACLGRRAFGYVSGLTFVLGSVSLLASGNTWLGLLWALSCASMPEDSFQRDEVSDPGLARKAMALVLTLAALASLVPHW